MNIRQPLYIVYHCYGNEAFFYECLFSMITLCRVHEPATLQQLEIWIYTDKPEWFAKYKDCPLQLKFRKTSAEEIKQWQGPLGFNFRSKIELARDFVKNRAGNVLYMDTDTCFIHPIDELAAGIEQGDLYMHVMEGLVKNEGDNILKKLHRFLQSGPIMVNGKTVPIAADVAMWNAGVLGYSTRHGHLLDEVLGFTDEVYPRFKKHTVEQFAFSVVFANAAQVHAASPYILHYWCMKEIRTVLTSFFKYMEGRNWADLVHHSQMIQMHVHLQEKISFLHNRTVMGKIKKEQWMPVVPDWELLGKQLQAK